ncbi:MAG: hypothetical protein A3E91_03875 [Candidatus Moranbacteria bacterium RIFCSPHIGHO2_12_FULL_40_10]|nr:MAG: hypothetical protein A3E91_03875 [Candidatus Moranbacteria bacterium RIFCSPHIGHO2_12_FULL_40_10]
MFPIIATIIAFLRQIVGIKAFGIYTPSIVIFALLGTGLKYGVAIFVSVILVGMVARFLLKGLRLLYLPRLAITLSLVAFSILVILMTGGSLQRTGLAAVSIFPLLMIIILVEKFIAAQIEKGGKTAMVLALETLIISLVGYYVIKNGYLIKTVVLYPWIVLLTVPINIFLGKWTGLRLSEYWRFREILKKSK